MQDRDSSSFWNSGVLLMPLLAVAGLFFGVQVQRKPDSASLAAETKPVLPSTTTVNDPKLPPIPGPLQILASFLAVDAKKCPPDRGIADCLAQVAQMRGHQVEALIVTVPDPELGSLSQYTDQALEAIQRGAESKNFRFRRFWVPWSRTRTNDLPTEAQRQPGLMIFDQEIFAAGKAPKMLLAFLVPETPTAGLDRELFAKAIQYRYALQKGELKILGPSFSGSATSLRLALADAAFGTNSPNLNDQRCEISAKPERRFRIVSGSATNPKNSSLLNCPALGSTYRAARTSDNMTDIWLQRWLESHQFTNLAILSESDTAYGDSFGREAHSSETKTSFYPFPSEISRVRAAYDEDAELKKQRQTSSAQQRTTLELRPGTNGEYRGRIPMYSPDVTPILQEKVLLEYVRAAREKRHDLVQVAATDPRDLMFLTDFFRSRYREAYYLVFDTDHLFSAQSSYSLEGLLSVADYPLFREAKPWHATSPTTASMSTQFANGFFNAMIVQLGEPDVPMALDQRTYNEMDRGPVWVTVNANGSSWPLAVLNRSTPRINPTDWPKPVEWTPAFCLLSFGALAFALLTWLAEKKPDSLPLGLFVFANGWRWNAAAATRQISDPDSAGTDPEIAGGWFQTALPTLFCALIAFMSVSFLLVEIVRQRVPNATISTSDGGLLTMAAVSILAVAVTNFRQLLSAPVTHRFVALLIWVVFLGLAALIFWPNYDPESPALPIHFEHRFFFYRALHLMSGVSPLAPMLLLAAMGISCLIPYMRMMGTIRHFPLPAPKTLQRMEGLDWATTTFGFRRWQVIVSILSVLAAEFLLLNNFKTLETNVFRWSFLFLIAALAIYLIGMLIRLVNLLSTTKALLNRAFFSSMQENFRELAVRKLPIGLWRGFGMDTCTAVATACAQEVDSLLPLEDPRRLQLSMTVETLPIKNEQRDWQGWRQVVAALTTVNLGVGNLGDKADRYFALQYLLFVQQLIYRCQAILQGGFVALILAVAALQSYEFHSGFTLRCLVVAFFLAFAAIAFAMFFGLERHPVLLAVQDKEDEAIGFQFYLRLLTTIGVPLATILASMFPSEIGWLFRWIGPLLGGLPQ
jgi:hypothetical protein